MAFLKAKRTAIAWESTPKSTFCNKSRAALLALFYVYLACGNLPRFLPLVGFQDNLLISEGLLSLASYLYYALFFRRLSPSRLALSAVGVIFSFSIGVWQFGFFIKPFLYALRLVNMLLVGALIGNLLYEYAKEHTLQKALKGLLATYLVAALLGYLFLIVFPDSQALWQWLKLYGISFAGDPHQRRLVSPYLDPNFYGAMAILPCLLSLYSYEVTKKLRHLVVMALLVMSIFLTASRSALATLFLVALCLVLYTLGKHQRWRLTGKQLIALGVCAIGLAVYTYVQWEFIAYFFNRFVTLSGDGSALARLISFRFGIDLWWQHPFFGLGYQYLAIFMKGLLSSVDSSPLSILINFGLLGTLWLASLFFQWSLELYTLWQQIPQALASYRKLVVGYYSYVVVCIVFSSNFNNLLFYQFWLIPTLAVGVLLMRYTQHLSTTS